MNLFELVEILQRVRGVDREIQREHHGDKWAQKWEISPQAVKEKKTLKEISSSECWMGKKPTKDILGISPFSRGAPKS